MSSTDLLIVPDVAGRDLAKPAYRVPLLADLPEPADDAPTVISTFTGAGGSCLGFRMAGYRTLCAVEFIAEARDTYAANFPGVSIEPRDIREVGAAGLLERAGVEAGDVDVLEGSPPCSAFSLAGKREKGWGVEKAYSSGARQRVDDLFYEYARLVDGVRPRVFVAENVPGLIVGSAKGYFKRIIARLREPGYHVEAVVIDAARLGVPQRRKRLIFIGVRPDVADRPVFPKALPYVYSLRDALESVSARRPLAPEDRPGTDLEGSAIGREWARMRPGSQSAKYFQLIRCHPDLPCPTINAIGAHAATPVHPYECRRFSIPELRRLCSFPDDFRVTGKYAHQYERMGRAVPPLAMRAVAATIREAILCR